ncbi:MAG TPA: DMT family transporter [Haliangium sp.]|nr:DMT family transporter [Haliangium sp.]
MHEDARAVSRAVLRLIVGAVMISFAPVFVRVTDVPPTVVAVYRMLIGGLVLLGWVLARGGRLRVEGRVLLALALAGVAFGVDLALWHRSIWYIGPGLATLLANFQVFVLAVTGVLFFGERLHARLVISIILAVAGLGLIVGPRWDVLAPQYRWGVILGLMTAGTYAVYILSMRWAATRVAVRNDAPDGAAPGAPAGPRPDPARDLALSSLVSAVCLSASAMVEGESLAIGSLRDASLLAGYALVAQVLGGALIASALGQVPASRVGLILLLQPALALVWDVLFFARPVMIREIAGAVVALVAIYLGTRLGPRPGTRPGPHAGDRTEPPAGPPADPAPSATWDARSGT